jgi:hypothetical protein
MAVKGPEQTQTAATPAATKVSLGDFMKGSAHLPPRIIIHGRQGVGKTLCAASCDSPVFLLSPGETGLHSLMDAGQVPESIPNYETLTWESVMGSIEALINDKHSRKTLVVDTISGWEKLANAYICHTAYDDNMTKKGFLNYMEGYKAVAMSIWKELLVALDRLRRERQMMVVLLAHTGVGNHKNPTGEDYNRWVPQFEGKPTWEATFAWADIVLMAEFEIFTKENSQDKAGKQKAVKTSRRYFRTEWSPAFDAKNRYGMPAEIEMGQSGKEGWDNIMEHLQKKEG